MNLRPHAQQTRLPRLIKVQAACLVARLDAEGVETALGQQVLLVGLEADLLSALGRVEIEVDRQLALADQGKAAAAAGAIGGLPGRIDAKHAHRRDQEAGRGRQSDGQGAAAGVAGRIAERQAQQVASPAGHRRPGRAAAELQVDQRQQRQQRERAGAEKGADLGILAQRHEQEDDGRGEGEEEEAERERREKGRKGEGEILLSFSPSFSRLLRLPPLRFLAFLPFHPTRLAGQQPPRRDSAHAAHGKPDRRQGHQEAAGETDRRALPGNVQREKGRADGRQPPGSQPEEHQRRVAHSGQRADQTSRDRHQQALARQKPRDLPGAKAQGQEQTHVFGALFDPQAEQEHDEHHRRGDHEETEG